jgi:sirohydrochlorin ferrochelatase
MTSDTLLLIGRETPRAPDLLTTHAERLRRRAVADSVLTATFTSEPVRELRKPLADVDADRVFAVPMCVAHSFETVGDVPAALSSLSATVTYCEPIGASPAVTDVLTRRANAKRAAADDVTLVLVGFGSSSKPYHRQTAEYHAARIEEETAYGDVLTCYLLQNPTVECVRYNVSTPKAVAVPLFLAKTEATAEEIPAKLELDRGGMEYAAPLGDHPRVTDAIEAEVTKQRALATDDGTGCGAFESQLTSTHRPVATDGDGLG